MLKMGIEFFFGGGNNFFGGKRKVGIVWTVPTNFYTYLYSVYKVRMDVLFGLFTLVVVLFLFP